MRFGWAAYIVPFLFVYSPGILMKGSVMDIVIVIITSIAGIWLICAAMVGYFTSLMKFWKRILFLVTGILMLLPHQASSLMLWLNIAGLAMGATLVAIEMNPKRRKS
jgi:TRAP-type uncharacterized transport system fused permease subunit